MGYEACTGVLNINSGEMDITAILGHRLIAGKLYFSISDKNGA